MANYPVRRAQLIAPFGTGALLVAPDGLSLITAGLDHWYKREGGDYPVNEAEFRIQEWRLQERLGVEHFRLPPDFRKGWSSGDTPNRFLTVPFLRFPQWHFCPQCKYLDKLSLTASGRQKCKQCETKGKTRYLLQVPFVAMCEHGHVQDFPWREWVHSSANPTCQQPMRLVATGAASLAAQKVKCDCGKERSLAQITTATPPTTDQPYGTTYLSDNLESAERRYLCSGQRPWLGTEEPVGCGLPLRGSLRSASNLYFADVRSAIYLPRSEDPDLQNLISLLDEPPLSNLVVLIRSTSTLQQVGTAVTLMRGQQSRLLQPYSDEMIKTALEVVLAPRPTEPEAAALEDMDAELAFRREEFEVLRTPRDTAQLLIRESPLQDYGPFISAYFSKIMLVNKLRETRALAGFYRVVPENKQSFEQRKALLWRHPPASSEQWLPAYTVYGEGIFLELDERRLQEWENSESVLNRIKPIRERYGQVAASRGLAERDLSARFVLLHTLAHLLINRLTFECGYSSASLRERLYVATEPRAPMAGVLIYTAAGDSEGTMGGLVRMGQPEFFEPVVKQALLDAMWCSADPVCMEIGAHGGQGPDSCNLAACHSCCLVPETACEEFNRFLDRAVVIGDIIAEPGIAYFDVQGS